MPAHPKEYGLDARADGGHAPIGQAGRDEPDYLAVAGIVEPPDDPYRIAIEEAAVVVAAEVLEDGPERGGDGSGATHAAKDTNVARLTAPTRLRAR
jgi:hypothetical protein